MASILEPVRQLARGRRLAGALQAGHQHNRRRLRRELYPDRIFAQNFNQFIADDLDDLLARRKRGHHSLTESLRLYLVDELLYNFEIDVSFEQRQTQPAQPLLTIFFAEDSLPAQRFECTLKPFLKVLKHRRRRAFYQRIREAPQAVTGILRLRRSPRIRRTIRTK